MNQKFNIFNEHEDYNIKLCNPDKSVLAFLNFGYEKVLSLRFNEMSEFTMVIPYKLGQDKNGNMQYFEQYDSVKSKKLIFIEDTGYFLINNVQKNGNGIEETKTITAYSLETELSFKKINLLSGTYKFYDLLEPEKSLLGMILSNTNWTVGVVDPDLFDIYRTFEIPDSTVYEFLLNDVENTFECIFQFNSINRTVSAYSVNNILYPTDIVLSYDNLLKEIKIDEKSDEVVTALNVYGADSVSIATVNPMGTATMYNFSYYANSGWMSQGLIDAIGQWRSAFDTNQPIYADLLTQLKTSLSNKNTEQAKLDDLTTDSLAKEGVVKAMIAGGLQNTPEYSAAVLAWELAQSKVVEQQQVVLDIAAQIDVINVNLKTINENLQFSKFMTQEQLLELNPFIIENTYQDSNFVITKTMTDVEAQEMSQALYNQALNVLERLSTPRYTFSVDGINFIFLKEYIDFTADLRLGCIMNIIDDYNNTILKPVLLELTYQLDDPEKFEMTFGNRFRLDSGEYTFKDLFSDGVKAGSSVSFESAKWGDYVNSGMNTTVSEFINSSLDCAKNNVINATNQEIVINQNGLRGRNYISPDIYSGNQVWLTSNTLSFTSDNWRTCGLALGEITIGTNKVFGLAADAVFGDLIAGNNLVISNENNTFKVDGSGAFLENASFTLTSGNNIIKIDPIDGFSITNNNEKTFYLNTDGTMTMTGDLTSSSISLVVKGSGVSYGKIGLRTYDNITWPYINLNNVDGKTAFKVSVNDFGNGVPTLELYGLSNNVSAPVFTLSIDQYQHPLFLMNELAGGNVVRLMLNQDGTPRFELKNTSNSYMFYFDAIGGNPLLRLHNSNYKPIFEVRVDSLSPVMTLRSNEGNYVYVTVNDQFGQINFYHTGSSYLRMPRMKTTNLQLGETNSVYGELEGWGGGSRLSVTWINLGGTTGSQSGRQLYIDANSYVRAI